MRSHPDDQARVLADEVLVAAMVPWACPCDFGPGGRYQLEELVGAGRESLIYRAVDRQLSSGDYAATVAIKIASADGGRLRLDALSGRRISHPNVLAVLDHGRTEEGVAYVVTEYVDGGDLTRRPGPWPAREAAAFIAKLARGVQAAHAAGVVHCDLKPANILLTAEGEPKLGDFDLCRALNDEDERAGVPRGNYAFMAPEQFLSDEGALTPPADIYALGGLLYWLLTGRCPNGETREEITAALRTRSGPPRPGIERDLDLICARAMAVKPEDRYHSAGELAEDLARWLRREVIPGTNPSIFRRIRLWTVRHPVWAVVLVSAVVVLSIAAGFRTYVLWYTMQQRHEHELQLRQQQIEAQQKALEDADARLQRIKSEVRALIRFTMEVAMAGDSEGTYDRVLPTYVWLSWVVGAPMLPEEARIPTLEERIDILRKMLPHSSPEVGPPRVDHMLAQYSLAYFLIDDGSGAEAAGLLRDLREGWTDRLHPQDPLWKWVAVMEDLAAALEAAKEGAGDAAREHLDKAAFRLRLVDSQTSIARLYGRVKARLEKAEQAESDPSVSESAS